MTNIPALSFNQLIAAVERLGFIRVRQRGHISDLSMKTGVERLFPIMARETTKGAAP